MVRLLGFLQACAAILVAMATVGSVLREPAGCPWQMASLWSFKGPCHQAADADDAHRQTHRHRPPAALAGLGGAEREVGAPAVPSLSLFIKSDTCVQSPQAPKGGPLQIAPQRGC